MPPMRLLSGALCALASSVAMPLAANAQASLPDEVRAAVKLIVGKADHRAQPFVVIDKKRATLWLFDATALPLAHTAVLLGSARGDDSAPGIGERALEAIAPSERTTPAGRFVAEAGINSAGEDVIWVDYDAAVSMHRVRTVHASQRRMQRLASRTPADNRISYGCINVPAAFFDRHLWRWVRTAEHPVVYVLPETRAISTLFTER